MLVTNLARVHYLMTARVFRVRKQREDCWRMRRWNNRQERSRHRLYVFQTSEKPDDTAIFFQKKCCQT